MNAFHNTAEQVGILAEYSKQYVEQKITTTKLDLAEKSAKLIAELASWAIALVFGTISIFFLLIAAVYLANLWLHSMGLSFLLVGLITMFIGMLALWFRKAFITNPILTLIVEIMFEEDDEE